MPAPLDAKLALLVGRWTGSSSVYAGVVDDHQTYTKRAIELEIDELGGWRSKLAREPSYRCEATGKLRAVDGSLSMEIETSTCSAAKPGARVQFTVERVGSCVQQWNRKQGTFPFEVEQLALRRAGCQDAK